MSNLTGQQLVNLGYVTGQIDNDNIQQHGVDLNVILIRKIVGPGFIPKKGKTRLPQYISMLPIERLVEDGEGKQYLATVWDLKPGTYDILLQQGCTIPPDQRMEIIHRSSMLRCGGICISALFDAGFSTDGIGCVMTLFEPLVIEKGARLSQIVATASNKVNNLYNGQWQGDAHRKQQREPGDEADQFA